MKPTTGSVLVVDTLHHMDCLATAFGDRIEAMATRTNRPRKAIGSRDRSRDRHLLVGTSAHSPIGLMRDSWSDDEVQNNRPIDWMLTRTDAKRIRLGLLERSRRSRQPAPDTPRIGHRSQACRHRPVPGRFSQSEKSLVPAEERADVDLRSDGGNLKLAAATAWHPLGIRGDCHEPDTLKFGVPRDQPVLHRLRYRVEILIGYIKQLFSRRAFLEKNERARCERVVARFFRVALASAQYGPQEVFMSAIRFPMSLCKNSRSDHKDKCLTWPSGSGCSAASALSDRDRQDRGARCRNVDGSLDGDDRWRRAARRRMDGAHSHHRRHLCCRVLAPPG